jgi:uncharacterized protein
MTPPGAAPVPLAARALAPDMARGAMLLLIALANVHLYLHGHALGVRSYPADLDGADRVVAGLQLVLVDGRAYPLFGVLCGYGIGQLSARRTADGMPVPEVVGLVRRRGLALVAIGAVHAALLWSGDIVAAYGLLAVAFAGVLVAGTAVSEPASEPMSQCVARGADRAQRGSAVSVATTAVVGGVLVALLGAFSGFSPAGTAPLRSVAIVDPVAALLTRVVEWGGDVLSSSVLSVVGAVALGAWAARRRLLDDPARHRRLLRTVAVTGLAAAVLGGTPLALAAVGAWQPGTGALLLAGTAHTLGGYAGGLGYAAVFGLCAAGAGAGPLTRALAACGQRSLSCYLGQSVLFVALLPAWTADLGARLGVAEATVLAAAVWLVLLVVAVVSARAGYRGPAEVLLRRLTYGRRPHREAPA